MGGLNEEIESFLADKKILITGGTGSIGEKIVAALLAYQPREIIVFDRDDSKLYEMQIKYAMHSCLRYKLADIREYSSVVEATQGIDLVFHTAALKQVPICEENPFEAIKTNVIGSQNIIKACIVNKVKKVINISTDKAVNPTNTMGMTKLLAEKLFYHANNAKDNSTTLFTSVRFGNVIGSRGSVLPIFFEQIKANEPLTITDLRMTRFFMTIPEAVSLLFQAAFYSKGGEVFIFKMEALKITDLLSAIESYCKIKGFKRPEVKIIGIRQGEKLYEELMSSEELTFVQENDSLYLIPDLRQISDYPGFKSVKIEAYRSDQTAGVAQEKLLAILQQFG